jgi:predicted outer membrane protein
MAKDEEKNKIIVKDIESLKEITKSLKSKVLTSETAEEIKTLRKKLKDKLSEIKMKPEDFDTPILDEQTMDRQGQSR